MRSCSRCPATWYRTWPRSCATTMESALTLDVPAGRGRQGRRRLGVDDRPAAALTRARASRGRDHRARAAPAARGRTIAGFWTDWPRAIKHPEPDAFAPGSPVGTVRRGRATGQVAGPRAVGWLGDGDPGQDDGTGVRAARRHAARPARPPRVRARGRARAAHPGRAQVRASRAVPTRRGRPRARCGRRLRPLRRAGPGAARSRRSRWRASGRSSAGGGRASSRCSWTRRSSPAWATSTRTRRSGVRGSIRCGARPGIVPRDERNLYTAHAGRPR